MTSRLRFTHRPRLAVLAGMTAAAIALLAAAPAGAATTIGSDLASASNGAPLVCAGGCTASQRSLPGRQTTAPTDGVIVRWRIRVGSGSVAQPVKLRVIRGTGAASTGIRSSQSKPVPAAAGIYTFDTRLPVSAGDFIGIDCCVESGTYFRISAAVTYDNWSPPLGDGETRAPDVAAPDELMVNADIEPDCDADGFGDETQDPDTSSCNPPAGDTTAPDTTITKKPKNKTKKKQATFEFTSSEPGSSFVCTLDGKQEFKPCTSPLTVKVKKGKHTFQVQATDQAGNTDGSPATDDWKVKKKR